MSATPAAEQLIHEEAVREIERLRTIASELHARANLMIAAAAIAVSMLGKETFSHAPASVCLIVALAGSLIVSASAVAMIWPRHEMPMTVSAVSLLTASRTACGSLDAGALRRHLIRQLEVQQWLVARRNAVLSRALRVGGFGLLLQLAATVAARFLTI